MSKVSDVYTARFLKCDDLKGHERTLTIDKAAIEEVGQKKERKVVIYFRNSKKPFVCNKTCAAVIVAAYSDDMDTWPGKQVVLFPSTAEFQGKVGPAIRVRIPSVKPQPADDSFPSADDNFSDGEPEDDRPFAP